MGRFILYAKKIKVLSEICWAKETFTWDHFKDQFSKPMKNKWKYPCVSLVSICTTALFMILAMFVVCRFITPFQHESSIFAKW